MQLSDEEPAAFTNADVGKEMSIKGDTVKIDGKPRHVSWRDTKHHDRSGKITSVEEKYKGREREEVWESEPECETRISG